MRYLPNDFRSSIIKSQRERSEKKRQSEVEALIKNGGSIKDKYDLLWKQQMDRRRTLANMGKAQVWVSLNLILFTYLALCKGVVYK